MPLSEKLLDDMKSAMKARDELKVSTLRLARSAVKNAEIDKGRDLTDDEVTEILGREVKRRREAIEGYEKGGRQELVDKERRELAILSEYLPKQLDEAEIEKIAREVAAELGADGAKDKGRMMSAVMPRVRGRADGKIVTQIVDRVLQG
ncbi:MAG: GatB/YqeY domain-containing protein [Armatimonadota bacterium]|nr:GatB/YqeY domain-containing protein [Armatimonadota bacterium]